jgi:hypothetical protein
MASRMVIAVLAGVGVGLSVPVGPAHGDAVAVDATAAAAATALATYLSPPPVQKKPGKGPQLKSSQPLRKWTAQQDNEPVMTNMSS